MLKRYNHALRRLHETATAHLTSTPEWEVKCALGLHLWLDAEHATAIRSRVAELREPPLHLDGVPDNALERAFSEAIRARSTAELLAAVYGVLRAELLTALRDHLAALNPLFDHPTRRLLCTIAREQEEMLEWGGAALAVFGESPHAIAFAAHVRVYLAAAGGIAGTEPIPASELPPPRSDGGRYEMDTRPRRDARFRDGLNNSGKVSKRHRDSSLPLEERALALLYKRLLEMDVPEMMAPIIYRAEGKPWAYYADMSRQLWDEARHPMMGEVGLTALDVPFYRYPLDRKFSELLNSRFTPLEAHLILWKIEQSLMPRTTGKRAEWELARDGGNELMIAMQDYDWADEVLHAQIGRRHLEPAFASPAERKAASEEVWDRYLAIIDAWAAEHADDEPWWERFVADVRAARLQ
ncbi:MAG: hypothetical protein H0V20_09460 [Actinobacteria bacterium]|nr:hypothetical protein [Actinomycetota bacterium]